MKIDRFKIFHKLQTKIKVYHQRMISFVVFLKRKELKLKLEKYLICVHSLL